MFDFLKKKNKINTHFCNRLFNISDHEWPRVIYCFLLKLFADTGKVIGHTVILSMVASRLGVSRLPYVFIITGIFMVIGTSFVAPRVEKIPKKNLVMGLALCAGLLFIISRFILTGEFSVEEAHAAAASGPAIVENVSMATYLFFFVLLLTEGMFFVQMEIVLALFIEGYFTPMESQRAFPLIESAAIFAGLIGGSFLTFLHLKSEDLIIIWAFVVLLIIPTILIYGRISEKLPLLQFHEKKVKHTMSAFKELRKGVLSLRKIPFLKYMALAVFIYFACFYILEYQYTKAFAAGTHGEEELTRILGIYVLVVSLLGIVVQFVLSSRIIKNFGIVKSLMVHPLASIIGYIAMIANFILPTAFASKLLFDGSSMIYKNAYLSSFYAVDHKLRETSKALIEGWLFPAGMIGGTLFILISKYFVPTEYQSFMLNTVLIVLASILIFLLHKQKKNYTRMPIRNMRSSNHAQRHEAIEVLGEKGHVNNVSILTQYLRNWKTKADLKRAKVKILETLGRLEDDNTIPTIIDMFDDQDVDVKIAAVEALSDFTSLGQNFIQQTFSRYRLVDALQKLFEEVDSVRLRKGIIRVFSNLQIIEVVPFLLELLDHDDPELRADCIAVMGKFADPNIYFYLKDYLNDDHPKIRSNTIIALWQFKQYRLELLMKLTAMIDKNAEIETLVSGIYALGEIESKQEEKLLLSFLENENPIIRIYAAIALAKIEHNHSFSHIVEMIFHDDKNLAQKMKNMIHQIPKNFKKRVMALIHQEVSKRIHEILLEVGHEVEELSELKLEELIELYKLVKFEKEVMKLEKLLSK